MPQFPNDPEFDRLLASGELPDIPNRRSEPAASSATTPPSSGPEISKGPDPTSQMENTVRQIQTSVDGLVRQFSETSEMLKRVLEG